MAAGVSVDLELKKAFQDLQQQLLDTAGKMKQADSQITESKKELMYFKLADAQLAELPADNTQSYVGIGRLFVPQALCDIRENFAESVKNVEERIGQLEETKQHYEKSLKNSEDSLREMITAKKAK